MKRFLLAAALAAATLPAFAADVGVSINVGQPGFYGRIDIGDVPRPVLINPRPVIVQPVPVGVVRQPLYLHVPPGHAKHWRKHCHEYNACGEPVYFVDDGWYNNVYVPHYRERHGDRDGRRGDRHDWDEQHGKGHDKGGKEHGRGRDRN
ncbi:MAG TPA: hypothetical protein VEP67_00090 [Thiobacillaceae bacterium]|nr:hypothetical protein [Thiobacillaceae bacterium]